jgi:hypothetical protein
VNEKYLAPCGEYCGTCKFLNREEPPNCLGCGVEKGRPFWGTCKIFTCAVEYSVKHCGDCKKFLCDLFINQYDPSHGPESAFTRAGLLAYRKKAGKEKFIEMVTKLASLKAK